jgi:PAS domain S-box-containing protein
MQQPPADAMRSARLACVGGSDDEPRFRAIFQAAPLPIVVVAADATVTLWNPAAERLFGWTAGTVCGRPIPIVPPEKEEECARVRDAVLRGESFSGIETVRLARDGRRLDVVVSAAPLRSAEGRVAGIMFLFEDVTARRRTEAERAGLLAAAERARAQAEAASRAKDEFIAMLGHELRTPLSAVRNALVAARLEPERGGRAVEIAARQADQLARLVDDLLDVARITQGKIRLRRQRTRVARFVERALETARPQLEARAHAVTLSLPPGDVHVDGDPTRLEQVVLNLVSNAAKYTEPGGRIEVAVERDAGDVVIRVRDNGIGIAPTMLPRVFDLFAQADRDVDRAQGGLGIGLTVVRRLVELHGGRVEARSEGVGRGAEFGVRLPAAGADDDAAGVVAAGQGAPARAPVRVLLVEDNADAADSLAMLLEILGHRVRVATDGAAALDVAETHRPDVMLVDIGLPGMDGYEVARRVRRDPRLAGVTLVALTGYARDEDRRRALDAGFDCHLVKPVDIDQLQSLVAGVAAEGSKRLALH